METFFGGLHVRYQVMGLLVDCCSLVYLKGPRTQVKGFRAQIPISLVFKIWVRGGKVLVENRTCQKSAKTLRS